MTDQQHLEQLHDKERIHRVEYADSDSVEKASGVQQVKPVVDIDEGYDPHFVKKTMRKVDWRLIPPLIAMYCISSIDRKNVSLARAANGEAMQKELDLGTYRYNIITLVFFPPYIIFELPVSGRHNFADVSPNSDFVGSVLVCGLVPRSSSGA